MDASQSTDTPDSLASEPAETSHAVDTTGQHNYVPPYPIPSTDIPCTHPCLTIRYHPDSGRGVYATQSIAQAVVLSYSPLLLLSPSQITGSPLEHYTYAVTVTRNGTPERMQAVALGLGSLFNHSTSPNVGWYMDKKEGYITYKTTRDVHPGEALEICYGDASWMPSNTQSSSASKHDGTHETDGQIRSQEDQQDENEDDEDGERDVFGLLIPKE